MKKSSQVFFWDKRFHFGFIEQTILITKKLTTFIHIPNTHSLYPFTHETSSTKPTKVLLKMSERKKICTHVLYSTLNTIHRSHTYTRINTLTRSPIFFSLHLFMYLMDLRFYFVVFTYIFSTNLRFCVPCFFYIFHSFDMGLSFLLHVQNGYIYNISTYSVCKMFVYLSFFPHTVENKNWQRFLIHFCE